MKEWVGIVLTNFPFKIFIENNDAIISIIAGSYTSKYITLTNAITETIIGRDLCLIKWKDDYCDFQGILNIKVENIMLISPIKINSEFVKKLENINQSKDNTKIKIKQL